MIMSAKYLLIRIPTPRHPEIKAGLAGNLCRVAVIVASLTRAVAAEPRFRSEFGR